MGSATRILRMALHAFLSHHHPAATAAALLALPFSAAALLSRSPAPAASFLLPALSRRLRRVFLAAGFPPASSQLLFLLNHRLSHSILSSLATLPFSMTSLLLAKSLAVHAVLLVRRRGAPWRDGVAWRAMARTQVACYGAMLLAHAAVFAAMLAAFAAAEALRLGSSDSGGRAALALSAAGVIVYSVALANAAAVCNLATVVAAAEPGVTTGGGGFHAILKAILLVRGDAATAVAVALPATLATAAVEGLFQLRVARPYVAGGGGGRVTSSMVCEGILIAYIHSMICVLDTVITCMVYKTCKASASHYSCDDLLELEEKGDLAA